MKRIKKLLIALAVFALCLTTTLQVSAAVKISAKKITLTVGKSKTLKVKGTKKKVKWSSNKKSVATVNSKGKVTAKKKGTATITAKIGKKKYSCKVTVKEKKKTIKIISKNVKLEVGESATLQISNAYGRVTWKSSNKNIATVTSSGVVKGIKSGKCSVTGSVNGKNYTFSVEVYGTNEPEDYLSMSQKNALSKAKSYLSFSAFSRDGLIHQLEYEGFYNSEAVYAVDHCGANWYEQAVKKAKSYLQYSAFSKEGLIRQLEYEKFTTEQAQYGVAYCGANWYEQAVKKARQYLSYSSFSKDGLISQLEYEKFTHQEAVYGVEQNWY